MDLLFDTLGLSLFDSLSTTLQIVAFVLLLTTEKPLRNALVYLAALSGSYFLCGVFGYLALDPLRQFLSSITPSNANVPNTTYYQSEFLTGAIMTAGGVWYFFWKKKRGWSGTENKIIAKLRTMNSWVALGLGLFMSISSFPLAIPYLIILGKYATLNLDLPSAALFILFYNIGYASPMLLVLGIYLAARREMDDLHDRLHEKAKLLNLHLTAWTLAGFGIFSMIDAGCYFAIGHAVMKERYF